MLQLLLGIALWAFALHLADGHAFLLEPKPRNIEQSCPHCGQAGGPGNVASKGSFHWPTVEAPGSHGLCGDPFQGKSNTPLSSEPHMLAAGPVQRTYTAGSTVSFVVAVSTHHKGHFEFRICDQQLDGTLSSYVDGQACLNQWVLERVPPEESYGDCMLDDSRGDCQPVDENKPGRWYLPPAGIAVQVAGPHWDDNAAANINGFAGSIPASSSVYHMKYRIPADLHCTHCTLQWYWATGNTCMYDEHYFTYFKRMKAAGWSAELWQQQAVSSWAVCDPNSPQNACCKSGTDANSAKFGEEFWNCADIAVQPGGPTPPPTPRPPTRPPTPMPPTSAPPTPPPSPVSAPTVAPPSTASGDSSCYISMCGCPDSQGNFPSGYSWCNPDGLVKDAWCVKTASNCAQCNGKWCAADPGGGGSPPTQNPSPTPMPPSGPSPTLAPPTPSGNDGNSDEHCVWTSPLGRQVQMDMTNEKMGRKCWNFVVAAGTTVLYKSNTDIYHSWNADVCCNQRTSTYGSDPNQDTRNIVSFTPTSDSGGHFGFCECTAWDPANPGTSCAGQATSQNMLCPVYGADSGMCTSAFSVSASCSSEPEPEPESEPESNPEPEPPISQTPAPPMPTASPTSPTLPTPLPTSSTSTDDWDSRSLKMTHYWDCSGQGCDATDLQPWNADKYVSPPGYGPQDPNNFGGALYGEKMWLTGAASDAFASILGPNDPCCGRDSASSGGCGKCLLVKNPDAKNADWTVVIMKKNRCPPWTNGCESDTPHFDVAAPGFDNLAYSTANICGQKAGTGFDSKEQSAALGSWYNQCTNTAECQHLCDDLPAAFQDGCRLFASWGWKSGDPGNVKFKAVTCPPAFTAHVGGLFDATGVTQSSGGSGGASPTMLPTAAPPTAAPPTAAPPTPTMPPTATPPTAAPPTAAPPTQNPTQPPTQAATQPSGGGGGGSYPAACRHPACGCPPNYKASWCKDSHTYGEWCSKSQNNCNRCGGHWCKASLAQVDNIKVVKKHKFLSARAFSMVSTNSTRERVDFEDEEFDLTDGASDEL